MSLKIPRVRRPLYVSIRWQMILLFAVVFLLIFSLVFYWGYQDAMRQTKKYLTAELIRVSEAAAAGIDGDAFQALAASDLSGGAELDDVRYVALVEWLDQVRRISGQVKLLDGTQVDRVSLASYVSAGPDQIAYVGSTSSADEAGPDFGQTRTVDEPLIQEGLERSATNLNNLVSHDWGTWVSAAAPIRNAQGQSVGAVEVNLRDTSVLALQNQVESVIFSTFAVSFSAVLICAALVSHIVGRPIISLTRSIEGMVENGDQQIALAQTDCTVCSEINILAQNFEAILKQSRAGETRYRALLDSLPGPAFLCDITGAMYFVTPKIEELLGYSVEEFLSQQGRFWMEQLGANEKKRIRSILADVKSIPAAGEIKTRIRRQDGVYNWIEARFTRFEYQNQLLAVGIILDIETQQQAREELRSYIDELKIANVQLQETQQQLVRSAQLASVGELATVVAHEINNPLAAVRGLAQLLTQEWGNQAELREPLDQIIINTERMSNTVKNLRSFSHPLPEERESIKLNQLLDDALTLISAQLEEQEIILVRQFGSDLPLVNGVPGQLGQVVINLLTNARDAIMETGAPGKIIIHTYFDSDDQHVHLRVVDNGVGIPVAHRDRIFAPFFTTKPDGYGTGLGLSSSYRIVQQHNGHILFESTPGEGTIFTVILPAENGSEK